MKYIKLLALLMLPMFFSACSDDDNMNGGEATVGFEQPEITISETATSLNLPIMLEGEHNGLVKVNIVVKDCQGTNVENDKNIILTSGEFRMPADVNSVTAEFGLNLYTQEDDFNRAFTVEITSVEGATVGTSTCVVKIEEARDAYPLLAGKWEVPTRDAGTAGFPINGKMTVTIETNEDKSGYNCLLGEGQEAIPFRMKYSTKGLQVIAEPLVEVQDESGTKFDVWMGMATPEGQIGLQDFAGKWNESFDTITFEGYLAGPVMTKNMEFIGQVFFLTDNVMTKKK